MSSRLFITWFPLPHSPYLVVFRGRLVGPSVLCVIRMALRVRVRLSVTLPYGWWALTVTVRLLSWQFTGLVVVPVLRSMARFRCARAPERVRVICVNRRALLVLLSAKLGRTLFPLRTPRTLRLAQLLWLPRRGLR